MRKDTSFSGSNAKDAVRVLGTVKKKVMTYKDRTDRYRYVYISIKNGDVEYTKSYHLYYKVAGTDTDIENLFNEVLQYIDANGCGRFYISWMNERREDEE